MDFDDRPGAGPAMSTIPIPLVEDPKKSVLVETTTGTSDIEEKQDDREVIIKTGADASAHLLPLRDDFDPALTFRSLVLATGLAAFQAVMYQIYMVTQRPMYHTMQADLTGLPVQTYINYYPRNFHRHHCLLPWQGLVQDTSSW